MYGIGLEGDFNVWKKNKGKEVALSWVGEDDRRLFEVVKEHRKLVKESGSGNWLETFRDSVELKRLIRRDFRAVASRNELEGLVRENRVPILAVNMETEAAGPGDVTVRLRIRNVGTVPAFRVSWVFDDEEQSRVGEIPVIAPGDETRQGFVYGHMGRPFEVKMQMKYYMSQGHVVQDDLTIGFKPVTPTFSMFGATCDRKSYRVGSGDTQPFVVLDAE